MSAPSYIPYAVAPVAPGECAICHQEFTKLSHFTYVRGLKVCRDSAACMDAAAINDRDREEIAREQRFAAEMASIRQRLANAGGAQ